MKKIGAWGDSITWGAFDDEKGGWVSRLRDDLSGRTEVYNLGISGDKLSGVLARFEREFNDLKPDTVLLAIGINDSPHDTHKDGTPLDVFEENFNRLIEKIKARTDNFIILGPTNVIDDHSSRHGYTNAGIRPYALHIERAAKQHGVIYVDLWGVIKESDLQGDGLHPEAEGHEKIFRKVKEALDLLSEKQ